jgi:hypothetical protein
MTHDYKVLVGIFILAVFFYVALMIVLAKILAWNERKYVELSRTQIEDFWKDSYDAMQPMPKKPSQRASQDVR